MYFKSFIFLHSFLFLLATNLAFRLKESLIIDTDAGADDAMAISMLLSQAKYFNVEAITCVQGNGGVRNVSINVLKTLGVANRLDIPVYVGSDSGLVYNKESDHFFGFDALGDFEYFNPPSTSLLRKEHSAIALATLVKQNPGRITVVCLGPLTNLALASHINKNFFQEVKRIMILGGSYKGQGNIGPGIEFNMYADAEAAAWVFQRLPRDTPTVLVPFETATEKAFSLSWRLNTLGKVHSKTMAFLNLAENETFSKIKEWTSFDPSLASVLINPNVVVSTKVGKPVVNTSTNRGYMNITFGEGSVTVVTALDKDELGKTLINTLS